LLGGLQIDHQLEFCRLFYRQTGGLCVLQDFVDKIGGVPAEFKLWRVHDLADDQESLSYLALRGNLSG
jgi:hypothetical protein